MAVENLITKYRLKKNKLKIYLEERFPGETIDIMEQPDSDKYYVRLSRGITDDERLYIDTYVAEPKPKKSQRP
ncbi:hypothetical protein MCOR27_008930 [Pyricularia oryzae]|uniref:Uncharacterized protein n=1 Tax=Pyricularia grisea TaxID=148305 RepID=A0ABQ8NAW1_PYRGI|nr:hypothetical protein MCOR01_010431 [Pyricularia oryzae]KAI6294137.1 hypothetical protein MCOR33_008665 [Pyricularia grisea]KAH9438587.1 hypothetical protein MCOR02_002203 [Pyricularia oryzae]KAI6260866.1 hypothetical protein MCOR19_002849 [Pyricularia oryzae]KAI6271184.1 hypothetical protein MCOR27_008930 [Pyricularia oryzae]